MKRPLPGPMVTFWTKAPEDAPEVKGYTCYFKPERLEWRVRTFWQGESRVMTDVVAHGPATRVEHRQGEMCWSVEDLIEGDTLPPWLPLPLGQLVNATLIVEELTEDNHESAITIDPLIVECPVCLSGPGDQCVRMSDGTTPCPPHDDRWNKARCFLAHPSQVAR